MIVVIGVLMLFAAPVSAQSPVVVNPQILEFVPSPDHDTIQLDGTPLLLKYEMRVYPEAGGAVIAVVDLGKPTPAGGLITLNNRAMFSGLPSNVRLIARVAAVGTGGSSESDPSGPFGNSGSSIPRAPGTPVVKK